MKLVGMPVSKLFTDAGMSSELKTLEHIRAGRRKPNIELFAKILEDFPHSEKNHFLECITKANSGDAEAFLQLISSTWKMAAIGSKHYHGEEYYHLKFMTRIEDEFRSGIKIWFQGDRVGATKNFVANESLSPFLWPSIIELIIKSNSENELKIAQLAITLEIAISLFSAIEIQNGKAKTGMLFLKLLPTQKKQRNPISCFTFWLKKQLHAKTLSELLNHEALRRLEIDESTVKRWSSGKGIPDKNLIIKIAEHWDTEEERNEIYAIYVGMLYMNFIGYYWHKLQTCTSENAHLPYEQNTFEDWVNLRYPYWYQFHKTRYEAEHI